MDACNVTSGHKNLMLGDMSQMIITNVCRT